MFEGLKIVIKLECARGFISKIYNIYTNIYNKYIQYTNIWVKVFKNGPSKICGRQPEA